MLCNNCIFYGSCKNMIHSKECVNNRNIYNMAKAEGIKQGKAEGIDEFANWLVSQGILGSRVIHEGEITDYGKIYAKQFKEQSK